MPTAVATAVGVAFALGWVLAGGAHRTQIRAARREANTDPLTGLTNRRGLMHQMHIRARRGCAYTVFMLDLNGFKAVNDTHGHRAGDELLCQLGDRLRRQLPELLVARLGGDEFVVLAGAREADSFRVTAQILRAVNQPTELAGVPAAVSLGTAIGVARAVAGTDPRAALHAADLALYRSKALKCPQQVPVPAGLVVCAAPQPRMRDQSP